MLVAMCLTDRKKTAPRKGAARVWERPSSYFLEAWEEDEDCGVARQNRAGSIYFPEEPRFSLVGVMRWGNFHHSNRPSSGGSTE